MHSDLLKSKDILVKFNIKSATIHRNNLHGC